MESANDSDVANVSYATDHGEVSKKTDLRVIRTRRSLWESLVELVAERSINDITVGEITKNAMVNRATFYRHFEDKSDLLERGTAEILTELATRTRPADDIGDEGDFDGARAGLMLVLDHVADHAGFYRVMLSSAAGWRVRTGIRDVVSSFLMRKIGSVHFAGRQGIVPDELTTQVVTSMVVGLVTWWIEESMPVSKQELIEYYLKLAVLGPYRCLGFQAESVDLAEDGTPRGQTRVAADASREQSKDAPREQ